jgi:hypothetical protein
LSAILGLLLLIVYIVAIVGLAALITYAVVRIFPTQRGPKKPGDDEAPSSGGIAGAGGRLFRSAKRQTG